MLKKSLLLLAMAGILIASPSQQSGKKEDVRGQKSSPAFLIVDKIPHLVKMIQKELDNPEFNLTQEQKTEFLAAKNETMSNVQRLAKEINPLEDQIAKKALDGTDPQELKPLVDKVAALKAEATMVQLQCIYKNKQILTKKQYDYLMNR